MSNLLIVAMMAVVVVAVEGSVLAWVPSGIVSVDDIVGVGLGHPKLPLLEFPR